jgi:hypothetical protein
MPSKRLRVLLTFTHEDDHLVEQRGGSVIVNLYGNKFFPGPPVDQTTVQSALTDFTTAVAASAQGGIHVTANKNKIQKFVSAWALRAVDYVFLISAGKVVWGFARTIVAILNDTNVG